MTNTISNKDDVIDTRDLIARIEELEGIDGIEDKINGLIEDEDAKELVALREFASEIEGYCEDFKHGATLIRDSYFEDYARELAEDCGMVSKDQSWPNNCIDWEQAANELQQDYTSAEFDGVTYWVR